jgi:hypothetical protein
VVIMTRRIGWPLVALAAAAAVINLAADAVTRVRQWLDGPVS